MRQHAPVVPESVRISGRDPARLEEEFDDSVGLTRDRGDFEKNIMNIEHKLNSMVKMMSDVADNFHPHSLKYAEPVHAYSHRPSTSASPTLDQF